MFSLILFSVKKVNIQFSPENRPWTPEDRPWNISQEQKDFDLLCDISEWGEKNSMFKCCDFIMNALSCLERIVHEEEL